MEQTCQHRRFLGETIAPSLGKRCRDGADEFALGALGDLFEYAFDHRGSVFRKGYPDLHRRAGDDGTVPNLDHERIGVGPAEPAQQAEQPIPQAIDPEPTDGGGLEGKVAGRPGAVREFDGDPVISAGERGDPTSECRGSEGRERWR